jgi:hypothetical protein
MLCYESLNKWSLLAVLRFLAQTSSLAPCGSGKSQSMMSFSLNRAWHTTYSLLISKQAVPYWTCGDTCCSGVSTPKIWSLADSSTTCHDGINHLHHSNHCSNHNTDPHHSQLTSRRMEDHLSQRHKPNSTSQKMKDLPDTYDYMAKHN